MLQQDIYDAVKGQSFSVTMFDDDGVTVTSPSDASRFYVDDMGAMVVLFSDNGSIIVQINISATQSAKETLDFVTLMRSVARQHLSPTEVKKFVRKITPRDFANNDNRLTESISRMFGTQNRSYQDWNNCRLVIIHANKIDEEKRGARSRNVDKIFIENALGERFLFPHKDVVAARAMTRHVTMGGTPYDNVGQYIDQLTNARSQCKCDHDDIATALNEDKKLVKHISKSMYRQLGEQMKAMSTKKGYNNFVETFDISSADTYNVINEFGNAVKSYKNNKRHTKLMLDIFDNDNVKKYTPILSEVVNEYSHIDDELTKKLWSLYSVVDDNKSKEKIEQLIDVLDDMSETLLNKLSKMLS